MSVGVDASATSGKLRRRDFVSVALLPAHGIPATKSHDIPVISPRASYVTVPLHARDKFRDNFRDKSRGSLATKNPRQYREIPAASPATVPRRPAALSLQNP